MRKAKSLGSAGEESSILKSRKGELSFLPEKTCAICFKETSAETEGKGVGAGGSTDVTNPYEAIPCGHLYCYICITSKIALEEGEGWECLRCSSLIKKCRPWKGGLGDDFSDEATATSSKKVGFESGGGEDDEGGSKDEGRRESNIDEEDLAKLTETLVDEDDQSGPVHNSRDLFFAPPRRHSSGSGSGSGSEGVGQLGESYDHLDHPPAVAVTTYEEESEPESEHTERGGPRGTPSVANSIIRSRSPARWDTIEDDEEDVGGLNQHLHPGKVDIGDHDSVYDTAGEED